MRSRINRRRQVEEALQLNLNNIIEKIKKEDNKDLSLLQSKYGKEVQEYMRAGAEEAYKQGLDYVTLIKNIPSFITTDDLKQIKDLAFEFYDPFWRKVNFLIHRNDSLLQKYDYEPRSELNSNYIATVTAITLTTRAIAVGTISKLIQIQTAKARVKKAGLRALFRFKEDNVNKNGVPRDAEIDQLQWNAILDQKTCPTCRALDGSIWNFNDPNKPIPGDDYSIHPNCRCFYDILPSEIDLAALVAVTKAFQVAPLVISLQDFAEQDQE